MSMLELKEYQKRSRDNRKASGGKIVSIVLKPDEAQALAKLQEKHGLGIRDTVGKALLDAAKRAK